MEIFELMTPVTYWLLIIMWTFILAFYIKRLRSPKLESRLFTTLLIILAIDSFRTLFESLYFGAWYTSRSGLLPIAIFDFLVRPENVFIPKFLNVIAAVLIIVILLRRWLPQEEHERVRQQNQMQELERRALELKATNNELEAFSYSVSHDLRVSLRGIDGFSHALLDEYEEKLDEQGKDYLHRVRAASQRMGQLIEDMLALSRITRREMNLTEVDLSSIAKDVAGELQQSAPERNVEFNIAEGVVARGDENLLRSVFENLLGNAWKFTSTHPNANIEFGVMEHNGKPSYFVHDDGAGFDMVHAEKLFSPFQRLHTEAEFPGTGIGLATVRRVVHRHGGEVWAEGEVEKGATFSFTLDAKGVQG